VTEVIYFLVRPDYKRVKIGYSSGAKRRIAGHLGSDPDLQVHAIIHGTWDDEQSLHKYFDAYRVPNTTEHYWITGEVAEYLNYLSDRAWAADSVDDIQNIYPYANRLPWQSDITSPITQGELFQVAPLVRAPSKRTGRILATILSQSDEWHTPPIYIEAARRTMGSIDLDPASNHLAQQIVRATNIITRNEDGLRHVWRGNIWLNPPFGAIGPKFIAHCLSEYEAGRLHQAILCLNSNSTDSLWFQPLYQFPICLSHHRPDFKGGTHNPANDESSPTKGVAFVYIGPRKTEFFHEFSVFGQIVEAACPPRVNGENFRRIYRPKSWDFDATRRGIFT
jgi:hypothetical protein